MASYLCGVDIGGTFTDCVVVREDGTTVTAKTPSTPPNFADGMIAALEAAAAKLGLPLGELMASIAMLAHGTTVGTNAIIQKRGAKVGLITTKGHNDVIHIMRGSRGLTGRDIQLVVHIPESKKPDPIVPKRLIEGVSERVDCFGRTVVRLNENEARGAIQHLLDRQVEAIAICFLWSFLEPAHERRVRDMAGEMAGDVFVTCSSDLVPKWGEYERTTAVSLNAYIGPAMSRYLATLDGMLKERSYERPLQITQCAGGTISLAKAMEAPLLTLDSGPVSGVTGSQYLGEKLGYRNIITTDMGGTSFDVGIISDGKPVASYRSLVNQYEYFLPKVDIQTIGSGGGSKVWIDETTGTLRVGPDSAGADPGPVCYGRGGTEPTVTDADLVLGYLDPDNFAGGAMKLDKAAAEAAIGEIARRLGMDLFACASGIAQIAEFQMADLIRKVTVQKGYDPRDFVLFAFGGAGPVHVGVSARELGVARVVVPQRETASVWCAFGAAAADVLHVHEQVQIMGSPFDVGRINGILESLESTAAARLDEEDVAAERRRFLFSLDMRHKGQINEVEVELDRSRLSEADLGPLRVAFVARYERLYGHGAALPGASLEIVTFRCRATAETPKPTLVESALSSGPLPSDALRPSRPIYWAEVGAVEDTSIFDGHRLVPGNAIVGPAVIETESTSVVVHPGQSFRVDAFGNFEVQAAEPAAARIAS
jgi:N-methylhydantoinase A